MSSQEARRDEGGGKRPNKKLGRRDLKEEKGEKEKENPGKSLRKGLPPRDWGERGTQGLPQEPEEGEREEEEGERKGRGRTAGEEEGEAGKQEGKGGKKTKGKGRKKKTSHPPEPSSHLKGTLHIHTVEKLNILI